MIKSESNTERLGRLLEKANKLPLRPGVYIMKNSDGNVIYVGKSRKLKNRVSQYFQSSQKDYKTTKMVAAVNDFDFFLCDTEMEALTLENVLIKEHMPKYNINLKDSKSYPYIKVTVGDEYPRLIVTRTRGADKAKYFGPYSGAGVAYNIVDTITKTLGLPNCKRQFPRDIGKERPCIYYQIGQCMGTCKNGSSKSDYDAAIVTSLKVLGGDFALAKKELERRMYHFAETENFEAAAKCRDSIISLEKITERQKVVSSPKAEQDVVALYSDDKCSVVSVFYIRGGMLIDKDEFVFSAEEIVSAEDIPTFLCGLYSTREYIPKEILLHNDSDEETLVALTELLSEKAGRKISVHSPKRGEMKRLCKMVYDNAAEKAAKFKESSERDNKMLAKLASILALDKIPMRIEAYDISNIGKEHITAGMIVAKDGKLKKKDYRSFAIKTTDGIDDYGAMREALARRMAHLDDKEGSFSERPDLILLDGGAGHVGTVRGLFKELGINIPVYGMVKDEHHKTRALTDGENDISIAREQSVFIFVYGLQEEVHRYSVSRMTSAKRKTIKHSVLEDVKGIGPATAKRILKIAGSLSALKNSSIAEMEQMGIASKHAEAIYNYFKSKREDK